jgi:hypothetical protein
MDLRLYGRVIWRFRIVVAIGLLLAIFLSLLSFVRVSFAGGPKISYRQSEDWSASTTYELTGPGCPICSIQHSNGAGSPLALSNLAALYAAYATSDNVIGRIKKNGPMHGVVTATSFVNQQTSQRYPLPLLAITADAATPANAVRLAHRASRAFMSYVIEQQNAGNIRPSDRIQFRVVNDAAGDVTLLGPRKKTLPVVIFLTILTATLGLAFVLENLRPRVRPVSTMEDDDEEDRRPRRSA